LAGIYLCSFVQTTTNYQLSLSLSLSQRFPSALVLALVPSPLWYACYASMESACSEVKERSLMDMRYSRCKFGVCNVVGCLWVGKGKDRVVHCRDVHGMGGEGK
jgi:hypothetical protein